MMRLRYSVGGGLDDGDGEAEDEGDDSLGLERRRRRPGILRDGTG